MRRPRRGLEAELALDVPPPFRFFSPREWRTFNRLVVRELEGAGFRVDARTPGEVRLIDEQMTLGLLNLAQQCRSVDNGDWADVIAGHVSRLGLLEDVPEALFDAADTLRVMLVPDDYLPSDVPTVNFHYAESVKAVLVSDLPASVRTVSPSDINVWGIDRDEAWQLAWNNTRSMCGPIDVATVEVGKGLLTVAHGEHFYTASHIRWLGELCEISDHGALVAIPRRSTMLIHPIRDEQAAEAIKPLILNARLLHLEGPRSVSAHLYWWVGGELRWIPSFFDEEDESIEFYPPPELKSVLAG